MIDTTISPATASPSHRKRLLLISGCIVTAVAAFFGWQFFSNSTLRTTDDAYVNGHVVTITPQVAGSVSAVSVENTDRVNAGQTLVELDSSDASIELAIAREELSRAMRRVRGYYAAEAQRAAETQLRQAELDRAKADLRDRQGIVSEGAISEEEVRHAADVVKAAQAALAVAQQAHAEAHTQVDGTTLDMHPDIRAAMERVRAASLTVERTIVRAPISGMIAQRSVQLGKRMAPGERLMAIVPLDQVWVDANFKEVQLNGVCSGQAARIKADIYGNKVTYRGTVQEIEAGSGAAFSLLPAQNASGNWIKVVQRIPVRIRLDTDEVKRNPLRIGMSVEVEIDTATCPTGQNVRHVPVTEKTALYTAQQQAADRRIAALAESGRGHQ